MLAFAHIWKTAGTTFTLLLRRHYGIRHFDRPGFRHRLFTAEHLRRLRRVYPRLQSIGGHPIRPVSNLATDWPGIRFHTFVRDPLERSISHFTWFLRWKAHDGVQFDDFSETLRAWASAEENRNLQCRFLSRDATARGVRDLCGPLPVFFMRVEAFDASLLLFREWAGQPDMDVTYQARNTARDPYERLRHRHPEYLERVGRFRKRLYEDSELRGVLRAANREDEDLVHWVREEVWPRQVDGYPGDLESDTDAFRARNAETRSPPREPRAARLYRNTVFKAARPFLLPTTEDPAAEASPWQ